MGRQAVSGTVTYAGAPVENGIIQFQPAEGATTSSGAAIAGGKFSIEAEKGLPPGKYKVRINAPKPGTGGTIDPNAPPGEAPAPPDELIPPEWNTKTNQTVEVKAGEPNEFKFEIPGAK